MQQLLHVFGALVFIIKGAPLVLACTLTGGEASPHLDPYDFISEKRNLCLLESNRGHLSLSSTSDNNTSSVSVHEMACSSMQNRFIPDSDSVYRDKSAVSLHDDVVTDGIDV